MSNSKAVGTIIRTNSKFSIRYMCTIGILTAIAAIVMLFEFPLWFAPGFYKLDFSEIVVAVGAFTLGPIAGVIIEFLKNILNLLLNGTTTAGVGELANFIVGCAFIVPSAIIYKKMGSFKGALIGLIVGTISLTVVGGLMNYYALLPLYSYFYKAPIDSFVEMGAILNSKIVDVKTLVIFATTPFNLFKGIMVSVVTLFSYNQLKPILHK